MGYKLLIQHNNTAQCVMVLTLLFTPLTPLALLQGWFSDQHFSSAAADVPALEAAAATTGLGRQHHLGSSASGSAAMAGSHGRSLKDDVIVPQLYYAAAHIRLFSSNNSTNIGAGMDLQSVCRLQFKF